jgi:hypothetical protein
LRTVVSIGVDELGRRLLTDPGDSWQIVGRITPQGGILGVFDGRDTRAFLDPGLVVEDVIRDASPVVQDLDVRILDKLVDVTVSCDDDHVVPTVACLRGQGGDQIVRFETGELDHRNVECVDQLTDQPHLLAEDVGRLGPARLVVVDHLVAKATAMWSGWWSFSKLISMEVNPNTALVTCPDAVAMSVGRAKKAR